MSIAFSAISMERKRLTDRDVEQLITLWHAEPSLWDTNDSTFCNADVRLAALRRISAAMENLDTGITAATVYQSVINCLFVICINVYRCLCSLTSVLMWDGFTICIGLLQLPHIHLHNVVCVLASHKFKTPVAGTWRLLHTVHRPVNQTFSELSIYLIIYHVQCRKQIMNLCISTKHSYRQYFTIIASHAKCYE